MTMYRDPIAWNLNRQILGEEIKVYFADSTVRKAEVIDQALSVELVDGKTASIRCLQSVWTPISPMERYAVQML